MNEEVKRSIEELKKAVLFSDTTCGINFNYTLSIKDVKLTLKYVEQLQQNLEKANKVIDELEKEIWKIREKTFHKKDKDGQICNEWVDCLSFNDDVKPLINKIKELKGDDK